MRCQTENLCGRNPYQQGVAGEHMGLGALLPDKTHAARRYGQGCAGREAAGCKYQHVTISQLSTGGADAAGGRGGGFGTGMFGQQTSAGDVVGVGMSFNRPNQLQPID